MVLQHHRNLEETGEDILKNDIRAAYGKQPQATVEGNLPNMSTIMLFSLNGLEWQHGRSQVNLPQFQL
jgi:hypothetical protein